MLSPDELKALPKFQFVVMKTVARPMKTKLELYPKWGIELDDGFKVEKLTPRKVQYADKDELIAGILEREPKEFPCKGTPALKLKPNKSAQRKIRDVLDSP